MATLDLRGDLRAALVEVWDELEGRMRRAMREELAAVQEAGDPNVLVDVKEAARLLGLSERALRKRLERGRGALRAVHVGRSLRLRRVDVVRLAQGGER